MIHHNKEKFTDNSNTNSFETKAKIQIGLYIILSLIIGIFAFASLIMSMNDRR